MAFWVTQSNTGHQQHRKMKPHVGAGFPRDKTNSIRKRIAGQTYSYKLIHGLLVMPFSTLLETSVTKRYRAHMTFIMKTCLVYTSLRVCSSGIDRSCGLPKSPKVTRPFSTERLSMAGLPAENLPETVWKVNAKNGTIGRVKGGSIWTEGTYGDFVLDLEFKLRPHCNSGIFIRSDPQNPVQGGFEIQLIDSYKKRNRLPRLRPYTMPLYLQSIRSNLLWNGTASLFDAKAYDSNPLNGELVVNANIDHWTTPRQNPDGSKNKFRTALKDLPRTGNIGFQDHR